jgi:hypothetical protein
MRKFISIAMAGIVVMAFAVCSFAADREQFSVNQLTVGSEVSTQYTPIVVSGSLTNLLERLYFHTYNPGVTNNISGVTGNLPLAAATNMLPSAGAYIGGNLASSTMTNGLKNAVSNLAVQVSISGTNYYLIKAP